MSWILFLGGRVFNFYIAGEWPKRGWIFFSTLKLAKGDRFIFLKWLLSQD